MKKNVWIWNHYATNMFKDQAGRHYWFAENLIKEGYKPSIFCASTNHFSGENVDTKGRKYVQKSINDIPFLFLSTPDYKGNGKKRIHNMFSFYRKLFPAAKQYAKLNGKPDVILASSVHPLTLVAGINVARKFGIPCICEVRDLWPETLVAYGSLRKNSVIATLLYSSERWIYTKADRLIFTMEGGEKYIRDKGWDRHFGGPIDLEKVHNINNGIDLRFFENQKKESIYKDIDLESEDKFKVVYAGSLGKANASDQIIELGSVIQDRGFKDIKIIIFGSGPMAKEMEKEVEQRGLNNIVFKGKVEKKYIPYILNKSDLNLITGVSSDLYKYGLSLNKMFDYMASGKPTLSNIQCDYDLLSKYKCGLTVSGNCVGKLADGVIEFYSMSSSSYTQFCQNALDAAENFDFKNHTMRLCNILSSL